MQVPSAHARIDGDERMHYIVAGILKPTADEQVVALRNEWNEHLSQPNRKIALFGLLRDREGERRGYVAFIQAENFDDAESYLKESPFYENDLYERVEVAEFVPQIGDFK
jgi:uncharacterized protein YciI